MTTIIIHNARKESMLKFTCSRCQSIFKTDEYEKVIHEERFMHAFTCPVCNVKGYELDI